MSSSFGSIVWLLRGLTGSTPGALVCGRDGRLRLTLFGAGALARRHLRALERDTGQAGLADRLRQFEETVLFDVPLAEVERVVFPWFYFGGGMHVHVGGVRYRLSFLQPQNTVADRSFASAQDAVGGIKKGVSLGARWREVLADRTLPTA